MAKVVGKREYTSMFDEFLPMIEEMCDQGFSVKQISDALPAGYSYQSLYSYIYVNRIREKAWKRHVDAKHQCNECEFCKQYLNGKGKINKNEDRICTKSWRVISASVRHCPKWCELETVAENEH